MAFIALTMALGIVVVSKLFARAKRLGKTDWKSDALPTCFLILLGCFAIGLVFAIATEPKIDSHKAISLEPMLTRKAFIRSFEPLSIGNPVAAGWEYNRLTDDGSYKIERLSVGATVKIYYDAASPSRQTLFTIVNRTEYVTELNQSWLRWFGLHPLLARSKAEIREIYNGIPTYEAHLYKDAV